MKPFLKEVAEELYRIYGDRMDELCLVFPNRRAGIYFNKYLGERLEQPVWSPSIYTIQDLMARISELEYADDLELIGMLYKVYTDVRGREESFDEFVFWGEVMLSDFDEVDKHLADAGDVFRNLADLKELERSFQYLSEQQIELINRFWSSFSIAQLSEQKKQFLEIWNLLDPVYRNYTRSLSEKGLGYEGMVYRNVAEILRKGKPPDLGFSTLAFIGFNALSPSEQLLFRSFQDSGRGLFYWDYDEYYLAMFRDSGNSFDRSNLEKLPRNVEVYSVPSDAGQAQLLCSILEDAGLEGENAEETAIVLADEELLIPVLNALPRSLEQINVTMGYPVSATPVFSLVEHLINLQRNLRKNTGKGVWFHYRDVLPLIQHQYITLREGADARDAVRDIHEQNLIYLPPGRLQGNALFRQIFRKITSPQEIADYLISILEMITADSEGEERTVPALELEFIYRIYTRIKRLKDVLGRLGPTFSLATFLHLFHKFLQRTRIPFSGEPLAGIQVMGVLETRVLDFNRVILLSMNEGYFPRTGTKQSFIPHNLRLGFGLPTLEYQDSIYAYYFYRLIQRSRNVHLIYNNNAEGLKTGEKSRFIFQMQYDPAFRIQEGSAGFDLQPDTVIPVRVDKTPGIMEVLSQFCPPQGKSYLSPSALNSYVDCPLQFYFSYVAGIKEPLELKEEIDPALFGSLLHDSVRTIYKNLENPVKREDIRTLLRHTGKIHDAIDESFRRIYFRDQQIHPEGRNRVIREIIFTYAVRILQKDVEYCPFTIRSLEEGYFMEMTIPQENGERKVKIGGKIDRIDRIGDSFRVLDYKTGSGRMVFNSLEDLFDPEIRNRNKAAFQTLLYAKLFLSGDRDRNLPVVPGIYLIRDIFSEDFSYFFRIGTGKNARLLEDYSILDAGFSRNLSALISRIFDPDSPFTQTDQEETCRNCLYKGLCQR